MSTFQMIQDDRVILGHMVIQKSAFFALALPFPQVLFFSAWSNTGPSITLGT